MSHRHQNSAATRLYKRKCCKSVVYRSGRTDVQRHKKFKFQRWYTVSMDVSKLLFYYRNTFATYRRNWQHFCFVLWFLLEMVIILIRHCCYQFSWECLESIDFISAIRQSVFSNSAHLVSCFWANSLTSFWLPHKWLVRLMVLPILHHIMGLVLLWYAAIIIHFVDRKVIGNDRRSYNVHLRDTRREEYTYKTNM